MEKEVNPAFQSNSFEPIAIGLDFFNLYGITLMIREIFELSPDGYRGDLMNLPCEILIRSKVFDFISQGG